MDLEGKVALVTGASGDIGGTIARDLAKQGANLVVCYLGNTLGAQAVLQDVQSVGSQAIALQLDQRNPDSIDQVVAQVVARYGQLNILVNNAAWNIGVPFPQLEDLTVDLWDSGAGNKSPGTILARSSMCRAVAGRTRWPHRQHRLGGWNRAGKQQHRLFVQQSRAYSFDPLPGSRVCPTRLGKLFGPRIGRGNPDGESDAAGGGGKSASSGGVRTSWRCR